MRGVAIGFLTLMCAGGVHAGTGMDGTLQAAHADLKSFVVSDGCREMATPDGKRLKKYCLSPTTLVLHALIGNATPDEASFSAGWQGEQLPEHVSFFAGAFLGTLLPMWPERPTWVQGQALKACATLQAAQTTAEGRFKVVAKGEPAVGGGLKTCRLTITRAR